MMWRRGDIIALAWALFAMWVTLNLPLEWAEYAILCAAMMVAVPLAIIRLSGRTLKEHLIAWGDIRLGAIYSLPLMAGALLPMWIASGLAEFQLYYPLWDTARESLGEYLAFELYVLMMMAWTEVFYRGFLLSTLNRLSRWGNEIHAILYMLAHFGKPGLEVPYSLVAGWIFGRVDMKCKSILPSLFMHFICSAVFDAMVIIGI